VRAQKGEEYFMAASDSQHPKSIAITVSLTEEDAQRLLRAFEQGELKQLGITGIQMGGPTGASSEKRNWSQNETKTKDEHTQSHHRR
jgi:hypothetical protein